MRRNLCQRLLPFFSHLREVLFLACIGSSIISSATYAETMNFESYHDSAGEVTQLSSERTTPFLFLGKEVVGSSLEGKYADSLNRFPSVLDCLDSAERKKNPDLTNFNWDAIVSNEDAEVCLFRVAASYRTPEAMRNWLTMHGFEVLDYDPMPDERVGIRATFNLSDNWPKYSSNYFTKLWVKIIAYNHSIGIAYDENHNVINVGVSTTVE